MSLSNWLGQSRQSSRHSGNGRSSRGSSPHLALSLYQRQYWHLCPHYHQLSAMYRPFICHCKTPVFFHYTCVYTIRSRFPPLTPHAVTNTGVSQWCRRYQQMWSGSRIRRDVYSNSNAVCVLLCVRFWLSGPYKQLRSPETHLSYSTEDGSSGFVFVSAVLPSEFMVLDWCEHVCVCVSLRVCVPMLWAVRRGNTKRQHGTKRSCLFACLPRWELEGSRERKERGGRGGGGGGGGGGGELLDRGVERARIFINSCKNTQSIIHTVGRCQMRWKGGRCTMMEKVHKHLEQWT